MATVLVVDDSPFFRRLLTRRGRRHRGILRGGDGAERHGRAAEGPHPHAGRRADGSGDARARRSGRHRLHHVGVAPADRGGERLRGPRDRRRDPGPRARRGRSRGQGGGAHRGGVPAAGGTTAGGASRRALRRHPSDAGARPALPRGAPAGALRLAGPGPLVRGHRGVHRRSSRAGGAGAEPAGGPKGRRRDRAAHAAPVHPQPRRAAGGAEPSRRGRGGPRYAVPGRYGIRGPGRLSHARRRRPPTGRGSS